MTNRRESVGRLKARTQSASSAPVQEMVSVAVLPPRLNAGMAPPTGIGGSEAMSWDESLNWRHNERIDADEQPVSKRKSLFRKAGLTTQRQKVNPDTPPFMLRQVPYDTWRKHYAKDKEGNYRGTHAPAQDCLLKPHDVEKWRFGDPVTKADKWTRGTEALPVYAEVRGTPAAPEYEDDYDGPPQAPHPTLPEGEDYLDPEDDRLVSHLDRQNSTQSSSSKSSRNPSTTPVGGAIPTESRNASSPGLGSAAPREHSYSVSRNDSIPEEAEQEMIIADGKTAKEIIAEAKERSKGQKVTWKQMLNNGVKMASFGG